MRYTLYPITLAALFAMPLIAFAATIEEGDSSLKVEGSKNISFSYQDYQGQGGETRRVNGLERRESMRVNVSGQLQKKIKLTASFLTTDNPLSEDQISAKLATDHLELLIGDINASFEGSEFTLFNRQIFGARLNGDYEKYDFSLIASKPKGEQRYVKLYGNDSQGPFSLSERVVEGSERISVNKQKMAKGRDYEVDYLIGEIRFTSKIIEDTDLLEIEYEHQPEGSSRRLYGGRFVHHPWKSWSYGITLVDDRDKKDRIAYDAFGTSPTAISVGSFDTAIRPFKGTELKGEVAGSIYEPNLFHDVGAPLAAPEPSRIEGGAYCGSGSTTMGPFRLGGGYKRVEPKFTNPGNLSLRQDMTSWNSNAAFKHKGRFSSAFSYQEDDYINVDSRENITSMKGDANLTPRTYPHLGYIYSRRDEKDTAVGYDNPYQVYRETSHRAKVSKNFTHVSLALSGEETERRDFPGLAPREYSHAAKTTIGLKNIRKFSAGASAELRQTEGKGDTTNAYKDWIQTYNMNVMWKPQKKYQVTGRGFYRLDSRQSWQASADGTYSAKFHKMFSSDGSYRLEFLRQLIAGIEEPTVAQNGNFSFKFGPWRKASLDYRPGFRLESFKNRELTYSRSRRDAFLLRYAPKTYLSTSNEYSRDDFWMVYTQDPALPVQLTQTNQVIGSTLNFTPKSRFRSTLSYRLTMLDEESLDFYILPIISYDTRKNRVHNASSNFGFALTKKLTGSLGYNYTGTRQTTPSAETTDNPVYPFGTESYLTSTSTNNMKIDQHGGTLGLDYKMRQWLTLSSGAGYSRTRDYLAIGAGISHTGSVTGGATMRTKSGLSWTNKYTFAKSQGQVRTERHTANSSLSLKLSKDASWSTTSSYTSQRYPFLATTTIRSNMNIRF